MQEGKTVFTTWVGGFGFRFSGTGFRAPVFSIHFSRFWGGSSSGFRVSDFECTIVQVRASAGGGEGDSERHVQPRQSQRLLVRC